MNQYFNLPPPDQHHLKQSEKLSTLICDYLQKHNKVISFADFMQMALYTPQLGYYERNHFNLDQKGDFVTAPHVSPLFAQCLSKQFISLFDKLHNPSILELGAGTGQFALDVMTYLDQANYLPKNYFIVEISLARQKQQYEFFTKHNPAYLNRVVWLDKLPEQYAGIVFANEVLDALPVHRFLFHNKTIFEMQVTFLENQFTWHPEIINDDLKTHIESITKKYTLPDGYQSEMHLKMSEFLPVLFNCVKEGIILFADYGYSEKTYYHPERSKGTLTCFYRHFHHENPFLWPGLQDITSHVNFSQVAKIALQQGANIIGYTNQASFLLSAGLMTLAHDAEAGLSEIEKFKLHQAIKTLTFPSEMGETIKFMGITKNWEGKLEGFKDQDRRGEL